jgi:integrase
VGVFKKHGNWHIDYYCGSERFREKVGPAKGEAKRALAVRQAQIAQGTFNLVRTSRIPTFREFAEEYEKVVSQRKRGHAVERYYIRMFVDVFGKRKISEITAEEVEKFQTERSHQVKPATVNRELTLLKHMFAKAVEWTKLSANPLRGVRSLEVPTPLDRILELDEEIRLLAACDRVRSQYLRPAVLLALNTGMRRGELLSLEWQRVDLIHGRIRILNAKTKSSARSIPLNAISYALLSELAQRKKSNLVFPSNRKVGERFLDLKKGFKKALELAGVPAIRFHDLRHTFATRLVQAGVDIITVQHLLGHAKISMTARYAHSPNNARIAAVRRLDELFHSQSDPNRSPGANGPGDVAVYKPQQVNTIGP